MLQSRHVNCEDAVYESPDSRKPPASVSSVPSSRSLRALKGLFRPLVLVEALPFVILACLQLLDWHSTVLAIADGRQEQNPLILGLANAVGLISAVSIFKAVALLLTAIYFAFSKQYRKNALYKAVLYCVLIVYSITIINNYS